ncbi:hypothetical protein V6N11_075060 [Hibiscus sabdariffa]|uniref:Uncharacterized protein n=1 Tax=Hibiscus sabdariffa TaxID=183260 RepID=A0ABR2R5E7_9ROSI
MGVVRQNSSLFVKERAFTPFSFQTGKPPLFGRGFSFQTAVTYLVGFVCMLSSNQSFLHGIKIVCKFFTLGLWGFT